MTRNLMPLAVVLALMVVSGTAARTQEQAPGVADGVSLSVEVAISRYLGDELVSRRAYVLALTADRRASSLGLHDRVPVPVGPLDVGPDGVSRPVPSVPFNHELVGMQIESSARTRGDGRFEVNVFIEESSVEGDEQVSGDASAVSYPPVFRSFVSDNTLVLRDGQSRQYLAATDPVSGETMRIDVTLTVLE